MDIILMTVDGTQPPPSLLPGCCGLAGLLEGASSGSNGQCGPLCPYLPRIVADLMRCEVLRVE